MIKVKAKRIDVDTMALFADKDKMHSVKCPGDKWTLGVGLLDVNDPLVDDPAMVSNRMGWCTVKIPGRLVCEINIGDVVNAAITPNGLVEWH